MLALELLDHELGQLDGVEGGTLAKVVTNNEHGQPAAILHGLILADAAHEGRILAGGGQRRGNVGHLNARCLGEKSLCFLGSNGGGELSVDGQAVSGKHGNAHTGSRDLKIRDAENSA